MASGDNSEGIIFHRALGRGSNIYCTRLLVGQRLFWIVGGNARAKGKSEYYNKRLTSIPLYLAMPSSQHIPSMVTLIHHPEQLTLAIRLLGWIQGNRYCCLMTPTFPKCDRSIGYPQRKLELCGSGVISDSSLKIHLLLSPFPYRWLLVPLRWGLPSSAQSEDPPYTPPHRPAQPQVRYRTVDRHIRWETYPLPIYLPKS